MAIPTMTARTFLLVLTLSMLVLLVPVHPVVAVEAVPATKSAVVEGLGDRFTPAEATDGEVGAAAFGPDAAGGADPAGTDDDATVWRSDAIEAPLDFVGLGVRGDGEEPELMVRTRGLDGEWSLWTEVGIQEEDDGPDPDTVEARRAARAHASDWSSTAIWAGPSTHVQIELIAAEIDDVSVQFTDTAGLSETRMERVGRWLRSRAPAPIVATASTASPGVPQIRTREEWGADESWRSGTPREATVEMAVLHHTATTNSYSREQADQQVRNMYHWHTIGNNGWNDLGYNFVVDRFGTVYEGRAGGVDRGIVGAHAANWNTGSFGVAIMGNYNQVNPDDHILDVASELMAWKYAVHGLDPDPAARVDKNGYRVRTMESHRNVRSTYIEGSTADSFQYDCPGQLLYWRTPYLRDGIANAFEAAQQEPDLHKPPAERVSGTSRYDTAAELSRSTFAAPVERVHIATGDDYPDALAAAPVAARADGPVLLTAGGMLPEATRQELKRLEPDEIVIVGGELSVSAAVEDALAAYGEVTRAAGQSRYDTAAELNRGADGPVDTVYLAAGQDFPDALSGGAVAAGSEAPLLLTPRDALPDATVAALEELRPHRIVVLGGELAVSEDVVAQARALATTGVVDRQAGRNRYETSARISQEAFGDGGSTLYLATGGNYPDALATAPVAGLTDGPLLLTSPTQLPSAIHAEITRLEPTRIVVVGGTKAISDAVMEAARDAAVAGR